MAAVSLDTIEHAAHLVGRVAVDPVENELGIAEDGVERGAQLVAHVGEELRFVLARYFELAALLLDLVEQPRVLDRQHGLCAKGLQQIDRALGKLARLLAADHQRTDDPVCAEQRNGQQGTEPGA